MLMNIDIDEWIEINNRLSKVEGKINLMVTVNFLGYLGIIIAIYFKL